MDDCAGFRRQHRLPVNGVAGTDLNGDLVDNDRPAFFPRNSERGPGFRELNLRVSRMFLVPGERLRLELIAETENLRNSANAACGIGGRAAAVVNRFGAADFGRITGALPFPPDSARRPQHVLRSAS